MSDYIFRNRFGKCFVGLQMAAPTSIKKFTCTYWICYRLPGGLKIYEQPRLHDYDLDLDFKCAFSRRNNLNLRT